MSNDTPTPGVHLHVTVRSVYSNPKVQKQFYRVQPLRVSTFELKPGESTTDFTSAVSAYIATERARAEEATSHIDSARTKMNALSAELRALGFGAVAHDLTKMAERVVPEDEDSDDDEDDD